MIAGQQGIVGWSEKGLPASCCNTSHNNQHNHAVTQSCKHRGDTPEKNTQRDNPLPAEKVANISGHRNKKGIDKIKCCSDCTYLDIRERQILLNQWQYDIKNLSVCLVDKESNPEQHKYLPFIVVLLQL